MRVLTIFLTDWTHLLILKDVLTCLHLSKLVNAFLSITVTIIYASYSFRNGPLKPE